MYKHPFEVVAKDYISEQVCVYVLGSRCMCETDAFGWKLTEAQIYKSFGAY